MSWPDDGSPVDGEEPRENVQLRRPLSREWHRLARMSASQFAKREDVKAQYRTAATRWALLWAVAMLEMGSGTAWTDERGQAMVVLRPPGPPRLRSVVTMVPIAAVVVVVAVVAWAVARPLAFVVIAALLVAVLDPPRFLRLRALPRSRALFKRRPRGSYSLQSLVRDPAARGAGRRLAGALCVQADAHGWVMNLDAGDEWLRDYYSGLGFVPTGTPVVFPWGQVRTPMSRVPVADVDVGKDAGRVHGVSPRVMLPAGSPSNATVILRARPEGAPTGRSTDTRHRWSRGRDLSRGR